MTTRDDFLGGRIRLHQPKNSYRMGTDTVFLAASLMIEKGEAVLDMGSGTGGILSCLAARISGDATLHGLEIQPEFLEFANRNISENSFEDRITYFEGDVANPPAVCEPNSYHQVVTNPPYLEAGQAVAPPNPSLSMAHMDSHVLLGDWIRHCLRMVRPMGYLTLVQRADRLDDILNALHGRAGDITVFPLWPKAGVAARRVIVRARKGGRGAFSLKSGMVVHKSDGTYTGEAENILRHGHPLDITQ